MRRSANLLEPLASSVRRAGPWRAHSLLAVVISISVVGPASLPARTAIALLTVNPTSATPGTQITATGTGFPSYGGNQIRIVVGQSVVATVPYQPATAGFSAKFAAPGLVPGLYTVTACVATAGICSSAPGTSASAQLRILALPPRPTSAPPTPPPPPPTGPGDLQISLDPLCCDPPAPSNPVDLVGPTVTPTLGLQDPGPAPDFPDLYVLGIEVSQNIQDLFSKMPLVADRKTWIRVHPRANTGSWAPIDGAILVKRGSEQEVLYPVNGPISTGLTADRADVNSALNFMLDPKWYSEGNLNISALVWAFSPSTLDDEEPNPQNNLMTTQVTFQVARKPNVHVVPLDDGAGPGPSPTLGWTVFSSLYVASNIVRYHPVAETNMTVYPIPLGPGGGGAGGLSSGTEPAWDLTTAAGRSQPLYQMFWYHQVLDLPSDERLFGLFDSSIPAGGYKGWAKSALKSAWMMPTDSTPSHEAGHLTGLKHVDCVGTEEAGGALDPTHPNAAPNCSLAPIGTSGHFGLTVFDTPLVIYSNDPAHPQAAYPLMSYADPAWNDPYHWCKMLTYYDVPCSPEAIGVPGIPIPTPVHVNVDCNESVPGPGGIDLKVCLSDPSAPDYDNYPQLAPDKVAMVIPAEPQAWLLVTGVLDDNGGVITQAAVVDELAPSLATLAAQDEASAIGAGGGGTNEIVISDSNGGMLARVKVNEAGSSGGHSEAPMTAHGDGGSEFAKVIPIAGAVASIKLLAAGQVMATKQLSANPPAISGLTSTLVDNGVRITWNVSDPDGDQVTSSVLWSADGELWLPVAIDTSVSSVLIGSGVAMPGGSAVRIKVIANDGVRTSELIGSPFSVRPKAPVVTIGELPDGSTIPRYYLGDLTALGYDPEDGQLPAAAMSWRSDLDGDLGTGKALSMRALSPGEHTITATATDSSGATGQDTIRLIVVDTGAPAPRMQGADPDAERRLLAGEATSSESTWIWIAVAVSAAVAVLLASFLLFVRRRRAVAAPPSS